MSATEGTPRKNFYVHVGAPDPIQVQLRAGGSGGTLTAFDSTLKFQVRTPTSSFTLEVGTDITLSAAETVADARASIQMTITQSRTIPLGALTTYELQRTVAGREEVILMGKLIAEGGDNPDA
jgi:hypothetical protein